MDNEKNSIYLANRLFKRYKTTNPFELCDFLGIKVFFENLGSLKGYTTTMYRIHTIHLNSDLQSHEQAFTCLHELGHIILKHNQNNIYLSTKTFLNVNKIENEANMFATHMILNKYNKEELQSLTIEQISNLTGVNKIHLDMYFYCKYNSRSKI